MDFLNLLGQTSPYPLLLEIDRAEGLFLYDKQGNAYADLISGIAVSSLGHGHPAIKQAINEQVERHLHVMVYGEFIQESQLDFAHQLTKILPPSLQAVYPVNSGTEAIEAAIKLVKRATGRREIIAFKGSYHGSTHGSMSISHNEVKKTNYRPLLPGIRFITLNNIEELNQITPATAGVFLETIQGDAGVRIPSNEYLAALRKRCNEVGSLLVLDEIQCGLGRTGSYFAFEHFRFYLIYFASVKPLEEVCLWGPLLLLKITWHYSRKILCWDILPPLVAILSRVHRPQPFYGF